MEITQDWFEELKNAQIRYNEIKNKTQNMNEEKPDAIKEYEKIVEETQFKANNLEENSWFTENNLGPANIKYDLNPAFDGLYPKKKKDTDVDLNELLNEIPYADYSAYKKDLANGVSPTLIKDQILNTLAKKKVTFNNDQMWGGSDSVSEQQSKGIYQQLEPMKYTSNTLTTNNSFGSIPSRRVISNKQVKDANDKSGIETSINNRVLTLKNRNGGEILRFEDNGDIYLKDQFVTNDFQIVEGFREYLKQYKLHP